MLYNLEQDLEAEKERRKKKNADVRETEAQRKVQAAKRKKQLQHKQDVERKRAAREKFMASSNRVENEWNRTHQKTGYVPKAALPKFKFKRIAAATADMQALPSILSPTRPKGNNPRLIRRASIEKMYLDSSQFPALSPRNQLPDNDNDGDSDD